MKNFYNTKIIGVDAGYGNMKTANFCFRTGIDTYETEPLFTRDMLTYNGKYYLIGEGHKNYVAEKTDDEDYYVLTLAAIAMELSRESLTEADVHIAAGLPLAWVTEQKAAYREYLLKNDEVDFSFRKRDYHIRITGADVFPQGYAAIADKTASLKGVTYLCDIGNGTMNLLCCRNGYPDSQKMYTEKYGTQQCVNAVKDAVMNKYQVVMDEGIIEEYLKTGEADVSKEYLKIMKSAAAGYVKDIFRRLQDHEYNAGLMRLYIVGGGGCLIRNFGKYDESRVTINEDICATAKGYEYLSERQMQKGQVSK